MLTSYLIGIYLIELWRAAPAQAGSPPGPVDHRAHVGLRPGPTIRASVGHFWNESYGQIYPNLKKLAAERTCHARRPKSKRASPTARSTPSRSKGRERLARWLAVEPQPEVPRNELLLKLFFGAQASPRILIGYLERMAEEKARCSSSSGRPSAKTSQQSALSRRALLENGGALRTVGTGSALALGEKDPGGAAQDGRKQADATETRRKSIMQGNEMRCSSKPEARKARNRSHRGRISPAFLLIRRRPSPRSALCAARAGAARRSAPRPARQPQPGHSRSISPRSVMDWALFYYCWAGVHRHGGSLWSLAGGRWTSWRERRRRSRHCAAVLGRSGRARPTASLAAGAGQRKERSTVSCRRACLKFCSGSPLASPPASAKRWSFAATCSASFMRSAATSQRRCLSGRWSSASFTAIRDGGTSIIISVLGVLYGAARRMAQESSRQHDRPRVGRYLGGLAEVRGLEVGSGLARRPLLPSVTCYCPLFPCSLFLL